MSKFFKALEQAERDRANLGAGPVERPPAASVPDLPPAERPRIAPSVVRPSAPGALNGFEEHLVTLVAPLTPEAEQYRQLRSVLEERAGGRPMVVGISSPAKGDGKTLTAVNLAGALCQGAPKEVLLVDGDLRNPSLAKILGMPGRYPGLSEAAEDRSLDLSSLVRATRFPHLFLLASGKSNAAPHGALQSSRIVELIGEARQRFDYVIVDTPPMVSLSDCQLIEKWVDGFLVVVAAHGTPRKLVEEALRGVGPDKVLGFVFNKSDRPAGRYYYYSYGYGAEQRPEESFWSSLFRWRRTEP
jgi:capsular exopolysaccharide synthesis family protein